MQGDAKQKSKGILPVVQKYHYIFGLEDILSDVEGHMALLSRENGLLNNLMAKQIKSSEKPEFDIIMQTTLSTYYILRKAAKNNKLPTITEDTIKSVLSEYPQLSKGLACYLSEKLDRISNENPLIGWLFSELASQHGNKPSAVKEILLTGITLYRILEEQTLKTN